MVIVNRGSHASLQDKIFWFKAKKEYISQVGNKQFNKFNKLNYDDDWNKKNRRFDVNQYIMDHKKTSLNIQRLR
jgi:hypothetical protein